MPFVQTKFKGISYRTDRNSFYYSGIIGGKYVQRISLRTQDLDTAIEKSKLIELKNNPELLKKALASADSSSEK